MAVDDRDTVSRKRKKLARQLAREGGYEDKNFDFIPDKDQLSKEELAAQYKAAVGIIYSVPELQGLFEQAIDEEWTPARLDAAVKSSEWYLANDESARIAWAMESIGGADWETAMRDAQAAVRLTANQMGSDLSEEELSALARRYIYEGWSDPQRQYLMTDALSGEIAYLPDNRGGSSLRGQAGSTADDLQRLALANGLSLSNGWYQSAAQSIAAGNATADDYQRELREMAAGLYPMYSERIRQGMNVYDLASPYINMMAYELELDPNQITLNDSHVRNALGGMSADGSHTPMSLYDFQKRLRQDPRWENTRKANNEITSVTGQVMQMFGLMGG